MNTALERHPSKQSTILSEFIQNIFVDVSDVIPALPKQASNDNNITVFYSDTGLVWHLFNETVQSFEDYNEAVEQMRDSYGYDIVITLMLNNNPPPMAQI